MRLTVVPSDNTVIMDGRIFSGLDMSSIPPEVHAIQWYGDKGEVEYKGLPNVLIEDLTIVSSLLEIIQDILAAPPEPIPEVPPVTEAPPVVISSDIITVADADLFLVASKEKGADGQPTSGALMAQWLINKLNL